MLGVDENLAPGKQIKASKKRKSVSFNTVTYYEYADEAASSAMRNIATRRAIAVDEARLMMWPGRKSAAT